MQSELASCSLRRRRGPVPASSAFTAFAVSASSSYPQPSGTRAASPTGGRGTRRRWRRRGSSNSRTARAPPCRARTRPPLAGPLRMYAQPAGSRLQVPLRRPMNRTPSSASTGRRARRARRLAPTNRRDPLVPLVAAVVVVGEHVAAPICVNCIMFTSVPPIAASPRTPRATAPPAAPPASCAMLRSAADDRAEAAPSAVIDGGRIDPPARGEHTEGEGCTAGRGGRSGAAADRSIDASSPSRPLR